MTSAIDYISRYQLVISPRDISNWLYLRISTRDYSPHDIKFNTWLDLM